MKLRTRFTLIAIGITLFLIIAPALVLYAQGFKYDFKTGAIIKTGTLVVNTRPGKAEIYLNDKRSSNTSPATIRFVNPGDYQIRIEKENYQPWEKRLSVKERLVTWANLGRDFIALFLSAPLPKDTTAAETISLARDGKSAGFINQGQVQVLDFRTNQIRSAGIAPLSSAYPASGISWLETGQIFHLDSWQILSPSQQEAAKSIQTVGQHTALMIDQDLFLLKSDGLNLLAADVLAYSLEPTGLWYVQNQNLVYHDLLSGASKIIYSQVPAAGSGEVFHEADQIYLILDQVLYVLNDDLERIHGPVRGFQWERASRQLLIYNDHELVVYVPDTKITELVLRTLTPISEAVLSANLGYVLYAHDNQIKAVELDGRGQRNVYTILGNFPAKNNFGLSSNGQILYTVSNNQIQRYQIW